MSCKVKVYMELKETEALAVSQLVKRVCFMDVKALAKDEDEIHSMLDGISVIREALAKEGFRPC